MSRLIHTSFLLSILYGVGAQAQPYFVTVSMDTSPQAPTHYFVQSQHCAFMRNGESQLRGMGEPKGMGELKDGRMEAWLETNEEVKRCLTRHSSIMFNFVKDGKTKLEFEFYKPRNSPPFMIQHSRSDDMDCSYNGGNVICNIDPSKSPDSPVKRGEPYPEYPKYQTGL